MSNEHISKEQLTSDLAGLGRSVTATVQERGNKMNDREFSYCQGFRAALKAVADLYEIPTSRAWGIDEV